MKPIIKVIDLHKTFSEDGSQVKAVNGVNLEVTPGTIFGFLGPNGAGKTTTLRILTTLMQPDQGEVYIAGYDVRKEQRAIRMKIGYVGQKNGCMGDATARENVMLQARLYGMTSQAAKQQIARIGELLGLNAFYDQKTRTLSGGQLRRVDLALGMIHSPQILFLDEPTTGLDPQSRAFLWEEVVRLKEAGLTIFLTTHYLDEADSVSDQIAIIDHGTIVAVGTSDTLKREISGGILTVEILEEAHQLESIISWLKERSYVEKVTVNDSALRVQLSTQQDILPEVIQAISLSNLTIRNLNLAQPSLNEVFLSKTGRALRDA
jgi:ABC-2 type transport system ATP-binding protein